MNQIQIQEKLSIIRESIENKKGNEKIHYWRYSQFKSLSEEISKTSGIRISHTTLIRILKSENPTNLPQLSTLNALVIYLGFKDWEEFLRSSNKSEKKKNKDVRFISKKATYRYLIIIILLIFTSSVFVFLFYNLNNREHSFRLELLNDEPYYPQVLSIKYEVPGNGFVMDVLPVSFKAYHTNKGNKNTGIILTKGDSIVTFKPRSSGHYLLSINKNNKTFLKKEIMIKSNGWKGFILSKERKQIKNARYKELIFQPSISDNCLTVPQLLNDYIEENSLDRNFETNYFHTDNFGIDANKIVFETRFRNTSSNHYLTGNLNRFTLLTRNGIVEIPITDKINLGLAKVWLSENIVNYEDDRENPFAFDQINFIWKKVRVEIKDFECKIFIDEKLVDSINYKKLLGELIGIRYKFFSNGVIDYCKIKDFDGKVLYQNDFDSTNSSLMQGDIIEIYH